MNPNQPPLSPITLPDAGKNWRWIGGTKPAVCDWCGREPVIASFQFSLDTASRLVGWDCLKMLDRYARERDADEGGDNGEDDLPPDGGVREPLNPLPTPPSMEAAEEIPT